MNKKVHFSRKIRQLNQSVSNLNFALENGDQSPSIIRRIKLKIKALLIELAGVLSKQQVAKILGSAAIFFGLSLTNNANAQTFAAPVMNPFGITLTAPSYAMNELVDLDGDGDLDLLTGGYYGALEYFENTGSATNPAFGTPVASPFGLTATYNLAFASATDLDNDGDFDLLVGEVYGNMQYFENTGSASAPAFAAPVANPFGLTAAYSIAFPSFVDLDNDGDADLMVGEYYGNMQYYENTGTVSAPAFAAPVQNPFGLIATYGWAFPEAADLDNDGDLDLLVGEYYGNMQYFENTGTASAPAFAAPVQNPFGIVQNGYLAFPAIGDLDGDSDLDLMAGNAGYGVADVYYYENTSINASISELENDSKLYPNPFVDVVSIESSTVVSKLEIYTVAGQMVHAIENPGSSVNLEFLDAGIYMMKTYDDSNRISTKKMRKQ